jgi:hypothetical protein
MAEEKKSIEISYKANLKDLLAKLKTIPNVTDQEAKKMVSALDRQLKQAEKASKKSAEASKKAAQQAAKAAQRGAMDFDDLADSARRAEERLERVGDASGDIDRGFSSIGLALRGVNPQLAEAADGLADAFAVTEGLTMSFAALNPYVIAAGVAIGALTLGYTSYQAEIEKARQLTLELRDAQKALIESQKEQENNMLDAGGKLREIQNEYKLLTGQITEYEYNLEKAGETAYESFRGNIDAADASIAKTELQIAAVESLISAYSKSEPAVLSEEMVNQLKTLQLQNKQINNNIDLTGRSTTAQFELMELQDILLAQLDDQNHKRAGLVEMQKQASELSMEMVTLEKELADANEEHAQAAKKIVKPAKQAVEAKEDELGALEDLIAAENRYFDRQMEAKTKLRDLSNETFLTEAEQKQKAFEEELEYIMQLGETAEQQEEALAIIKQKNRDKEKEDKKAQFDEDLNNAQEVTGAILGMSDAMLTAALENGRANQKTIMGLFRMNQAASVADIAFNTAKAVTAALSYPPVARAAMIAAAVGTGAAQTAVVMAQQPPQATFHMGGMAPDEMPARVLRGEAVLDRATVRRIGGEEGVRQLSQGTAPQEQVVVIQPFKHFGRFTREIGFKQPKNTGIKAY